MATPVPPLVPTSAMPLATDSDAAFDAKAFPALASLNPFGVSLEAIAAATATNADAALAAALGGDLPALTGNAGKFLRVNAGATAAEFAGAWERGGAPSAGFGGDFDDLIEGGVYTITQEWANTPPDNETKLVGMCALVLQRLFVTGASITQIVSTNSTTPTIYTRVGTRVGTGDPVVWSDWELMITSGNIAAEFNATGTAPLYACRAWVNFNGTGTVAIRASGNVSSITDNGTGTYAVNFTIAMPDVDYAMVSGSTVADDNTKGAVCLIGGYNSAAQGKTVNSCAIRTGPTTLTASADFLEVHVSFFR